MKKFKLLALAVMAMLGTNAMAVEFVNGQLKYETDGTLSTIAPYKVNAVVTGVNGGASALTGEVDLPGTFTQNINGLDYTVTVTGIANQGLKDALLSKITIPSTVKSIGEKAFTGCTNLAEIDLSNATGLTTLGDNAFETTHITKFDFTACTLLSKFPAKLFIETGADKVNELVTEVLMPTSASFTTFGTALAGLTKLATTNISNTKVTEVVENAFKGDALLKTVSLPGTVKTIASNAFGGSKVTTLSINVNSINTINENAFSTTKKERQALTSLTLTGTLKGTIAENAFPDLDGLTTFNLSGMSFGTNASICANAFGCTDNNNITSLELGAIGDNGKDAYTILDNAFQFNKLANVKIGAITANLAIGEGAFGDQLEKVEIASIKAGGLALKGGAFVFLAGKNHTITIGEIRAIANTPVMGKAAFTLAGADDKTATITLGAITAKGGNFLAEAFGTTAAYKGKGGVSMIFNGDIEENAIDVMLFTDASRLKTVTFNGAIATQGLKDAATKAGAFYGIMSGATVTFNGVLAENAVGNHAFEQKTPADDKLTVIYTATPADATKVPFKSAMAFGDEALLAAPYPVTLKISNADLAATIRAKQDAVVADNYLFRVGLVQVVKSLVVFQKTGTNTAYGRFFLSAADFANGMTIARHQDGITYNLYMTYVENDETDKIVTINMQPIPSFDGYYRLDPNDEPLHSGEVILVKATGVSQAETEMKYTDFDGVQNTGADLFQALAAGTQKFKFSDTHTTNNQLINNTATPAELKNLFDAYPGGNQIQDIYFLSNPANGGGIKAQAWDIRSTGVYVAKGSYYAVAPYYASAAGARTARIVWNDGDDNTTGIESIVKKVAAKNSVMYNLSGQKVDANYKGIVIKNGQKMIQK